jgi:zinc finger protein ZPR1
MVIDCVFCKSKNSMSLITKTENIPHFGEIMESVIKCPKCGYRHSDIICLEQKEPARYILRLEKANLNARVIKSPTGTISIPELGLKVEPGSKSQGYISNVEGVLNRFQNAVKTALYWAEDPKKKKNAIKILEEIKKIKIGEISVTMVVEDPFGHSKIINENVFHNKLNSDEIKELKTGYITFEK